MERAQETQCPLLKLRYFGGAQRPSIGHMLVTLNQQRKTATTLSWFCSSFYAVTYIAVKSTVLP